MYEREDGDQGEDDAANGGEDIDGEDDGGEDDKGESDTWEGGDGEDGDVEDDDEGKMMMLIMIKGKRW
jgi:hypothetical protein